MAAVVDDTKTYFINPQKRKSVCVLSSLFVAEKILSGSLIIESIVTSKLKEFDSTLKESQLDLGNMGDLGIAADDVINKINDKDYNGKLKRYYGKLKSSLEYKYKESYIDLLNDLHTICEYLDYFITNNILSDNKIMLLFTQSGSSFSICKKQRYYYLTDTHGIVGSKGFIMKTQEKTYIIDYIRYLLKFTHINGVYNVSFLIIDGPLTIFMNLPTQDTIFCPYINKNILVAMQMINERTSDAISDVDVILQKIQAEKYKYKLNINYYDILNIQFKQQDYFRNLLISFQTKKEPKTKSRTEEELFISIRSQNIQDEEFGINKNREYLKELQNKEFISEIQEQIQLHTEEKLRWEELLKKGHKSELSSTASHSKASATASHSKASATASHSKAAAAAFSEEEQKVSKQTGELLFSGQKFQHVLEEIKDLETQIHNKEAEVSNIVSNIDYIIKSEENDDDAISNLVIEQSKLEADISNLRNEIAQKREAERREAERREAERREAERRESDRRRLDFTKYIEELQTQILIKKTEVENIDEAIEKSINSKQKTELNIRKQQLETEIINLNKELPKELPNVVCTVCTYENPFGSEKCGICDTQLPKQGGAVNYKTKYLKYKSKNRNF